MKSNNPAYYGRFKQQPLVAERSVVSPSELTAPFANAKN